MIPNTNKHLDKSAMSRYKRSHEFFANRRISSSQIPNTNKHPGSQHHHQQKPICPLKAMPAKIYLSTKGNKPTINKTKQIKKVPSFPLNISICPLRKKFVLKEKLDSKVFKLFVPKIATAIKNGDVYPSSIQKQSKIDKLKSKNPLICIKVKISKKNRAELVFNVSQLPPITEK